MRSLDELDEAFGRALAEAERKLAARANFEAVAAAYEAAGARFARAYDARGEPAMALEVRRRAAEGVLSAGIEARHSPAACEALLARLIALGFSDLERKASMIHMFCGHFAECAGKRRLLPYLEPLIAELEAEHVRTGEEAWALWLRACLDVRARIERWWPERAGNEAAAPRPGEATRPRGSSGRRR